MTKKNSTTNALSFFKLLTTMAVLATASIAIVINPFNPIEDTSIYIAGATFYIALISAAIVFAPDRHSIESDWNKRVLSASFLDLFALTVLALFGVILLDLNPLVTLLTIIAFSTIDVIIRGMLLRVHEG